MSSTKEFFRTKKSWSTYKDKLLGKYLPYYFQKILKTNVDIAFIDGFAGQGIFDNGELGSPLIVKDIIITAISKTSSSARISTYFIEFEHAKLLEKNLNDERCQVINGDYKEEVPKILETHKNNNVFLYVDPFGIKHIHFSVFNLLNTNRYYTKELLLNLNSFGFIREGCKLLKVHAADIEQVAEEFCYSGKEVNDINNMNKVANGDYWQDIIKKNLKADGIVNGKQAEKEFTAAYVSELQKIFQYVISIPIRTGDVLIPKYQMIYATNHIDGILYMANNMLECELEMKNDFSKGQSSFFDYSFTKTTCEDEVIKMLDKNFVNAKQFCSDFYFQNGVKFLIKDINYALKNLENQGKIEICRSPSFTPTGKIATATNILDSKYQMLLRLK